MEPKTPWPMLTFWVDLTILVLTVIGFLAHGI